MRNFTWNVLLLSLFFGLGFVSEGIGQSTNSYELAARVVRTHVIPCNGVNQSGLNNDSFLLESNQSALVRKIDTFLIVSSPGQTGTLAVSQDFPDVSGQFVMAFMHDTDTQNTNSYIPDKLRIPAAQALAWEATCDGGNSRQYIIVVYYTGGG